jgi:hypothetical protein
MPHAQAFLAQVAAPDREGTEHGGRPLGTVWCRNGALLARTLATPLEESNPTAELRPCASAVILYGAWSSPHGH